MGVPDLEREAPEIFGAGKEEMGNSMRLELEKLK